MELRYFERNIVKILTLLLYAFKSAKTCINIGTYDFSSLDGVIWESHSGDSKYQLSLCQPVAAIISNSQCNPTAAVCQLDTSGQTVTVGQFAESPNVTETESGVIQLTLQGDACQGATYTTRISFKCGKTLGSPVFLNSYQCGVDFEWYTTVACKNPPAAKEVKCYVYNDKGQKVDLSPLIKLHGGYEVLNFGPKFYINVCRDITLDSSLSASECESESAACIPSGPSYKSAGHVNNALSFDDAQRPSIKYVIEAKGDDIPPECTQPPSTLVTFVCPARGESGQPTLLGSLDCQYEILWETEYACPEETLTSTSCMLTSDIHGVNVNLTPLQGHEYAVNGSNTSGKLYTYYLSVCKELAMECSGDKTGHGVTTCQLIPGDIDSGKSLGNINQQQLRYSDGELILTYRGGAKCHTNFQRVTVINFHCNKSLSTTGKLVFTMEDDCTYVFDLDTPLACIENSDGTICQVENQGHLYDLNDLVITKDMDKEYWEALKTDENDDSFVILNVCRELADKGLASLCDKGAAACVMDKPGHWISLGKPSQPVYDEATGQIQLRYTDGSPCNDGHAESIITFICKPGTVDSPPRLIRKSNNNCRYEFEWETASICAQHQVVGHDCMVIDNELGLSFDLRPLTNTDKGYYLVHHSESHHDYYINVCAGVTGTPCNTAERTGVNVAACQIDTLSNHTFVTGLVNTNVRYGDNFLNLTYTKGDHYNSSPMRDRSTEIAFFCNPVVGKGKPEFVEETNYTYVFRWETSYACADVPVECAVVDNRTGAEYDLSSLVRKPSQSDWVTVDDEQSDQKKRSFYINICHHLVSGIDGCDPKSAICEKTLEGSTEVVSHANLGKSTTAPVIDSEGELTIVLTGGEICVGRARNYTKKKKVPTATLR